MRPHLTPTQTAYVERAEAAYLCVDLYPQPDGAVIVHTLTEVGGEQKMRVGRTGKVSWVWGNRGSSASTSSRSRRRRFVTVGDQHFRLYTTWWERNATYQTTMHGVHRHRWDDPDYDPGEVPVWNVASQAANEATRDPAEIVEAEIVATSVLTVLNPRQSFVIRGRFWEGRSLDSLGRTLGLTRERIRQIQAEAITLMRKECGVE